MKEWRFLILAGALFLASTGFSTYNTEQQTVGEDPDAVQPDHLSLDQRLGYAILTNAGYATVSLPPEAELQQTASLVLEWHQNHPDFRCIDDGVKYAEPEAGKVDPFLLLTSIVAAEKYNRGAFVRASETLLARALYSTTGWTPDFSLGLAQIRPSHVRAGLDQQLGDFELSDAALLDYTLSDCTNIVAAFHYIRTLLDQVDPSLRTDQAVAAVARAYSGASANGEDGRLYELAVVGAYRLLPGGGTFAEEEMGDPPPGFVSCARFAVGEPTGRFDEANSDTEPWPPTELKEKLAAATRIFVSFTDREPGPSPYRDRLATLRSKWILQQLLAAGVPADLVQIELSESDYCGRTSTTTATLFALPAQPTADTN